MSPLLTTFAANGISNYGFESALQGGSYELIATAFGTGSSRLITFSSVPSVFKHLQVRGSVRSTNGTATDFLALNINSIGTASYSQHSLFRNGSLVGSGNASSQTYINIGTIPAAGATTNAHNGLILDLLDYTITTKNKTVKVLSGMASSSSTVELISGGFYNTSTITQLDIVTASGNFTNTSRLSLYGIKG